MTTKKRPPFKPMGTMANLENDRLRALLKLPEPMPRRRRIRVASPFARFGREPVTRIEIPWTR